MQVDYPWTRNAYRGVTNFDYKKTRRKNWTQCRGILQEW